jgi:hypothetical protein
MTRSSRALAAAAVAAIATGVAVPALTSAQTAGTHDINAREKVRAVRFVHAGAGARGDRLALGDRVITRQALYDESDRPTGTLSTHCVNVGRTAQVFKATLQCTSIYRFRDGQVVSSGVVRLAGSPSAARIAIVGGTGAYRSVRGEVQAAAPVKGYDTTDVLHLDG